MFGQKQPPPPNTPGNITEERVNTNEEAQPLVWARGRHKRAIVWASDAYRKTAVKKKQGGGKKAREEQVGWEFDCLGIFGLGECVKVKSVYAQNKVVAEPDTSFPGGSSHAVSVAIDKTSVWVFHGTRDQDTRITQGGQDVLIGDHPRYQGQVHATFVNLQSENEGAPNIELDLVLTSRENAGDNIDEAANLGWCYYEWLTDAFFGLGIATAELDATEWAALAQLFVDNAYKLHPVVSSRSTWEEIQSELTGYFGGGTSERWDGKIYPVQRAFPVSLGTVPELTRSALLDEPVWHDQPVPVHETRVIFREHADNHAKREAPPFRDRSVYRRASQVIRDANVVDTEWVGDRETAARLAQYLGRIASRPPLTGTIEVDRTWWEDNDAYEGAVIDVPEYDTDDGSAPLIRVMVEAWREKPLGEWAIEMDVIEYKPEQYFADTTIDVGTPPTQTAITAGDLQVEVVEESPRPLESTVPSVFHFAQREKLTDQGFRIHQTVTGGDPQLLRTQVGFTAPAVNLHTSISRSATTIILTVPDDISEEFESQSAADAQFDRLLLYLEGELISVETITPDTEDATLWTLTNCLRARLDTAPTRHFADAVGFLTFFSDLAEDITTANLSAGEAVTFNHQAFSGGDFYPLANTDDLPVTIRERYQCPTPPGGATLNGGDPLTYATGANLVLAWTLTNWSGTKYAYLNFYATSAVTIEIDILGADGTKVGSTISLGNVTTHTITNAALQSRFGGSEPGNLSIEIYQVVAGRRSFHPYRFDLARQLTATWSRTLTIDAG